MSGPKNMYPTFPNPAGIGSGQGYDHLQPQVPAATPQPELDEGPVEIGEPQAPISPWGPLAQ